MAAYVRDGKKYTKCCDVRMTLRLRLPLEQSKARLVTLAAEFDWHFLVFVSDVGVRAQLEQQLHHVSIFRGSGCGMERGPAVHEITQKIDQLRDIPLSVDVGSVKRQALDALDTPSECNGKHDRIRHRLNVFFASTSAPNSMRTSIASGHEFPAA